MAKLNSSRIYGNLIVDNTITGNGSGLTALNASNISSGTLAVARGGTGATDATNARTNLGATTLGANLFTLTNVSAISFLRVNANNTVDRLSAADFRTAIGAGTGNGNGTVTSVSAGTQISGMEMTITNGTTTPSIATSITNAANFRTAIGAGTGNGTVTGVTGTSPIVSSGGTAPAISHANSGVTAGTYNNVTVNVTGHVTAGSNVGYLTAHPTITLTTDTTSTASPSFGGTFTAIDSVTRDGNGHVTTLNTKTITLPANPNTDTNTTYDLTVPESTTAIRLAGSDSTNDDITLTAGTNVTITRNSATQLTIASSFTDTNTASAVNNILKGSNSGTAITYAPYLVAEKAAGRIYEGTTNPTNATRVNYDGNFHATQLFEGGTRVLTAHPSVSAAGSSDNSGRTYIQDILLDSFGHVTGITTATETVTDTNTATAVDNILDGSNSGTAITYAPYATNLAATGNRLYTTTDVPTATTRLNLSSYLWATRLHSLGIYGGDLSGGNLTIGSTSNATKGTITLDSDTVISGSLTINGTTTTLNANTLTVDDKNIELGSVVQKTGLVATLATGVNTVTLTTGNTSGVIPGQLLTKTAGTGVFGTGARVGAITNATVFTVVNSAGAALNHATAGSITFSIDGPSDASAEGGGITLKGTTDKTFNWLAATGWTSNQNLNAPTFSGGTITLSSASPTLTTTASGAKTANFISNVINATATSSTASITKTGLDVQSTGTWNGTSAVNRALLLNATGGTINRALEVTAGTSILQDTTATTLTLSSTSPTLTTTASGAKTANFASNTINATATSSTASVTKTGLDIQSTGTWNGTSAVNRALLLNSSGGTINRALEVTAGDILVNSGSMTLSSGNLVLSSGTSSITSGATTGSVETITANSLTSGNGLLIQSSAAGTMTGSLLNVTGTGALTTGDLAKFQNNAYAGSTTSGLVDILTTSTARVNGSAMLYMASSGANATTSVESIGEIISVTNTGTTSTNTALRLTASGASTNRALNVTAGDTILQGMTATTGAFSSTLSATSPRFTTSINDSNGNEVIAIGATASAVNELSITNAATANAVTLSTSGGDTNIGLNINTKGTGTITLGNATNINSNLGIRAAATTSTSTQIPVFIADPASTTRTLVTRTPAQLRSDIGAQAAGSYLTSESDTLATVTGRGATTATAISLTNSTASTTTGTGALVVTGGVGVGGALNVGSLDIAKNVTKIGTSKTNINALSGFSSLDKNFLMTVTSVTGNGTTTVNMEVTNSTSAFESGYYVNIEGAVGTEQSKLNGVWKITGSAGTGNQFQFQIAQSLASGTYTTDTGTVHLATFHFFGLDGEGFFTSRRGVNLGSEEALNGGTTSKIKTTGIFNDVPFSDMIIENINGFSIRLRTGDITRMTVDDSGIDVTGNLVASGNISLTGASSVSTSTGALTLSTTAGNGNVILTPHGTGITTTARPLTITNATASTTTGSGALIVTGGVGVGGTVTATTFSGSGASLTSLPAGQLTGTIPSGVLGNSSLFIGTTSVALNRASASLALTGVTNTNWDAAYTDTSNATNANTASRIVKRDASGNFSAGTITATTFSGSGSSLTSLPAGQLTGQVAVGNGGTGQTTLALARNAMGLGNTTGALPIANGGTNAATTANARTNLEASRVRNGTTRTDMSFTLSSGVLTITLN